MTTPSALADRGRCRSSRSAPRLSSDIAGLVLLLGAAVLFFWPLWTLGFRFPIGGGDLWGQLHPIWSFVAESLRRGVFPLWSTRVMAGDPIIGEPQYGLLNPLNWLLFLSHPIPGWLVSLRGAASLWIAGVGLYLYLRRSPLWQLRQVPALVGAIAYMFSDPFIAHLGHPQFNDTIAWVPWILWGVDRAARRRRAIPAVALPLAALLLAGHGQAALYAACLLSVYGLWQILDAGPRKAARRAGRLALAVLLGILLAAPALLPAFQRLPYTERAIIPPNFGEYEFHLGMWRDFITPLYHGRNMRAFWAPWDRVESGYIGVLPLSLALLGLVKGERHRTAFLWVIGTGAVLLALGMQGPLYPQLAHLPLFDATWKTGRAIYLLSFALAIAAAQGCQALTTGRRRTSWVIFVLAAAALIGLRARPWASLAPSAVATARALSGLRLAAVTLAGGGMLVLLARRQVLGRAGLVLLSLAELVATGALADVEPAPSLADDPHAKAIAYLKADAGWFRVDVDGKARGLWSPASVMSEGFDVPQGTGNPLEIVTFNQFYWGIPHKGMPAYNLLGAKYIVTPKGAAPGAEGIWPVFTDDPLVDIHLNTNALPRAWLVPTTLPVGTLEGALAHVMSEEFEPWLEATVTHGPALSAAQGTTGIEVLAYGANRADFEVTTTTPALFVLSDLLYPGWDARVDGHPAPIHATNGLFRGVLLSPGSHRVEMRFYPSTFEFGLGLSGSGLLILSLLLMVEKRSGWLV
ncbi:MAG: YfhO family protein [Anaerolineae bacterium]